MVEEKWGIKMHPGTLWGYYKERKIRYLKADYHWSTKWSPVELYGKQNKWVKELIEYYKQEREIWYLDEVSKQYLFFQLT